jgi:hypothetical protein
MAGAEIHEAREAPFAVVLVAERWDGAARTWVREWRRQSDTIELVVVDMSAAGDLSEQVTDSVRVLEGHRGTLSMALNVGLETVQAPRVLFQIEPRLPPDHLIEQVQAVRAPSDAVLIGPGAPPAGIAQSSLDMLMLHLVPPDAVHQAPSRWATVPGTLWVLFPADVLRAAGGLEAAEPNFELALQDACLRLSRRQNPVRLDRIPWSVRRRTVRELADSIRALTAARIERLARRPDASLEPGWTFATRTALQAALDRDTRGDDRQRVLEQLGSLDLRPFARMPEWAPIARDQLRRMLVGLRQQQQRWVLEGLMLGLERTNTDGIPALLGRHPIRIGRGSTVLLPVERDDTRGLRQAIAGFYRAGFATQCTLAVVAGPSTSGRLRRNLGREWYALQLMAALAGSELVLHASSLTAPRALRMLAPSTAWVPVDRLQGEAWSMHARVSGTRPLHPLQLAPWPLDVSRPVRLLAWPEWQNEDALRRFVQNILAPLVGRPEVTMCLRFDADRDGNLSEGNQRLDTIAAELLPEGADIELLILSESMHGDIPQRLGLSVHAWVGDSPDAAFVEAVGAPVFTRPDDVLAVWENLRIEMESWDSPTMQ